MHNSTILLIFPTKRCLKAIICRNCHSCFVNSTALWNLNFKLSVLQCFADFLYMCSTVFISYIFFFSEFLFSEFEFQATQHLTNDLKGRISSVLEDFMKFQKMLVLDEFWADMQLQNVTDVVPSYLIFTHLVSKDAYIFVSGLYYKLSQKHKPLLFRAQKKKKKKKTAHG